MFEINCKHKIYSQHSLRIKKNQLLKEYGECSTDMEKFDRVRKNVIRWITSKRGCYNKTAREISTKIRRDYKHKPKKMIKLLQRFEKYFEYDDKYEDTNVRQEEISHQIININERLGNDPYDLYDEDEESDDENKNKPKTG